MADDNECKVYVGSLNFKTSDEGLRGHFGECGEIVEAHVIMERDTGRSRGFGFVTFQDSGGFAKALDLNGTELDGRTITVSKANARSGGGRGGYNRGGRRDYSGSGGQYRGSYGSHGGGGGGYGGGRGRDYGDAGGHYSYGSYGGHY